MNYDDLLTELAVIEALIFKFKEDSNIDCEEFQELKDQECYLLEQIANTQSTD